MNKRAIRYPFLPAQEQLLSSVSFSGYFTTYLFVLRTMAIDIGASREPLQLARVDFEALK